MREKTMVFCSAEYDAAVEARQKAESTTIERCAQWLEDNYPSARTIALEMRRALKDKP